MGNFSRNTFDALKRYTAVRLQQGVPLVDADWNEKDDIRRYELRAFLKWFVGNGVPANSEAFLIKAKQTKDAQGNPILDDQGNPIYASDDFIISGVGVNSDPENPTADYLSAGRCLVEGQDVFITDDIDFKQQPLYRDKKLAATDIVDPNASEITPIPDTSEQLVVYLDVWEWEVGEVNDPGIVNDKIGMETSLRLKRDWAVRVRERTTVPTASNNDGDYLANHSYYALATLSHGSESPITPADITDLRQTGLTLADLVPPEITLTFAPSFFKKSFTSDGTPLPEEWNLSDGIAQSTGKAYGWLPVQLPQGYRIQDMIVIGETSREIKDNNAVFEAHLYCTSFENDEIDDRPLASLSLKEFLKVQGGIFKATTTIKKDNLIDDKFKYITSVRIDHEESDFIAKIFAIQFVCSRN